MVHVSICGDHIHRSTATLPLGPLPLTVVVCSIRESQILGLGKKNGRKGLKGRDTRKGGRKEEKEKPRGCGFMGVYLVIINSNIFIE